MIADGGRRGGVGAAVHDAGHHPAHVGVHHRHPLLVGEASHRAGGVAADPGQCQQNLDIVGNNTPVFFIRDLATGGTAVVGAPGRRS